MPKYPRDRFDEVPHDLDRVGAHRSEPRRGRGWIVFAWAALATGVLVGAGVVALGVLNDSFQFVAPTSTSSAQAQDDETDPAATDPAATDAAGDDATGGDSTDAPGDEATETPTPTATAADPAAAARTTTIAVLNGTTTSGLASRASSTLTEAGWRVATQGNAPDRATSTIVYYSSAASESAALGVARSLGVATTQQSGAFPDATVTVVLGSDFSR